MTDRQQSLFFIAIVFLFTTGVGLVIYKQYDQYFEQKAQIDLEAAFTSIPAKKVATTTPQSSSVTSDQIINGWKVYRNDDYGFEINIPNDWEATRTPEGYILFASASTRQLQAQNQINCTPEKNYVNCESDGIPDELEFDNMGFTNDNIFPGSTSSETVNNISWTSFTNLGMVSTPGYDTIHNGNHYTFTLLSLDIPIFKKILNTFKFTK